MEMAQGTDATSKRHQRHPTQDSGPLHSVRSYLGGRCHCRIDAEWSTRPDHVSREGWQVGHQYVLRAVRSPAGEKAMALSQRRQPRR